MHVRIKSFFLFCFAFFLVMRLLATCILFERDQKELFENPRNCLISIKSLLSIDLYTVVSVRTRIRAIRGSAGTPSVKTCTCTRCNSTKELKPSGEQRTMLRYTRQVPKSAQTLESEHYHTRPEPSCFGTTSLISDNNQGGPYRKPHNKITQSGVILL